MDWDKLKIFHAVAEAGSFTNATINLNLSQSAISRQIQSLEQDLKVQLFERHARGLTLTENGEYVFKTANEVSTSLSLLITSRAVLNTYSPFSVRVNPLACLSNNCTFKSCSNDCICLLIADWLRFKLTVAFVKLPASATA